MFKEPSGRALASPLVTQSTHLLASRVGAKGPNRFFTIVHDVMTVAFIEKMNISSALPHFDMLITWGNEHIKVNIMCDFTDGFTSIEDIEIERYTSKLEMNEMIELAGAINTSLVGTILEDAGERIVEA
jgi:hypothetical protein